MVLYLVVKHQVFITDTEEEFRESENIGLFESEEQASECAQKLGKLVDPRGMSVFYAVEEHEVQ